MIGTSTSGAVRMERNSPDTHTLFARLRSPGANHLFVSWFIIGGWMPSDRPSNTRLAMNITSTWLASAPSAVKSDHSRMITTRLFRGPMRSPSGVRKMLATPKPP